MSWFKIDDRFHAHPKVLAAGNAALGLWARCGSYCAAHPVEGREGLVPVAIARAYGTKAEIRRLVDTGWWHDELPDGYRMHDYLDFNPTAEQVKVQREASNERQRRHRAAKAAKAAARHAVTNAVTDGVSHALPSRPVPSRPEVVTDIRRLQVVRDAEPATDDDGFTRTLELVVDGKIRDARGVRNMRAYRQTVIENTHAEDGELIRRMLADGTEPEQIALFVLGHGIGADRARAAAPIPWCGPDCPTCNGDAFVDTGDGLAPCPRRSTTKGEA